MYLQTGGGGKGIRPNQQHQQQQQQQHHQPHHQSHHQQHHPHAQQQQQPPSVHHGHPQQQQQQQQTHSHHPHQQHHLQQQQQQPQLSYYLYQQSQAPLPSGQHSQAPNNAQQGTVQLAPSPPTQASNATVTSTAGLGLGLGGGSSIGNSSSATNIARQQHAAATAGGSVSNIQHYTATSAAMQPPTSTTFMTSSYLQYQPSAAVMAAAVQQFTNNSTAHGGLAAATNASIYQTQQQQQQQQHHHHHHQPLQPSLHFYHPNASAAQTGPPHMHQQQHHAHAQQHQMRGLLAPTHARQPPGTYMLPPQMFLQTGPLTATPRPSLIAGAHQQAVGAGSVLQTGARNPGTGPTTYVTPPFCQPPLPIGPPGLTPPQTLLTASGLQTFGRLSAAATSSVTSSSLNAPNSGPISSTENVKPLRKHAIPIIDPITRENILDPKSAKKSTAVEAKPPSLTEEVNVDAQDQQTSTSGDKSITVSFATEPQPRPVVTIASKEKIDQQMQTDAVRDKSTLNMLTHCTDSSPPPLSYNDFEEEDIDFKVTTNDNPADFYSDSGNEVCDDEEEQITVLVAFDEGISAATTITGDEEDDVSHYEDVESACLVDVVHDQEVELQSEECDETKQIQDKTQQAFIAKPQQQHEVSATNFDAITAPDENLKQTQAAQNTIKPSSNKQNIASTIGNLPVTAKSALQLKVVKSTTMVTTSTITAATITTATTASTAVPKAIQKLSPNTSGASSSATSTPTHQQQSQQQQKTQQPQQQQQLKKPIVTPAVAAITKKNRKAPKRKESQKKLKHTNDSINRSNSSSNSNNNNLNNKSTLNANSLNNNINNNNTNTTTTTATTTSILTDLNNANNSSSSSNCNLKETVSAVNLRQQQQQQQTRANNNTSSKSGQQPSRSFDKPTDPKCDSLVEDTTTTAATGSTATTHIVAERKHVKTQEIVVQFLQPTNAVTKSVEEQQLQFLNSSSSACEGEDELQYARLQSQQQTHDTDDSEVRVGLRFGDCTEEEETDKPTELKANPPKVNASKSKFNPALINAATTTTAAADSVDCSRNMANIKETKATKVVVPAAPKQLTPPKPRKYSLEELKSLANSSEALKPPLVPCQKGDCIAQLFVSRHLAHHAHQMPPLVLHPHLQYQHMSFNESMEFVTGKRRGGGQPKKHHDHSAGGSSGPSSAGGISAGGGGGGGGMSQSQRKMIHVNLSLNEEIKLSESDNAWQPEALRSKSSNNSPAGPNDDIDAVLKKVRGVLNKLTPDNFEILLKSMTSIYMNTQEKMQQVMLLIFEKTVSEPNFAPTYAKFCKVLFQETKAESKSTFTNALIHRIQQEFEVNVNDADAKKLKLQPIVDRLEASSDAKERLELQAELEDQEYQFRRRAWGTVRFIGEMYKLQSLTSDRVLHCIESLLEHGCEEKLEYMCKLLTTVGQLLDVVPTADNMRMDKIFRKIQELVQKPRGSNKPQPKISSRVRFMMQDVLDLRTRNWDQPLAAVQRRSTSVKRDEKMHSSNMNAYEKNSNRPAYGNHNNQRSGRQAESREGGGNGGGGNYFMQKQNKPYTQQSQPASQLNIDLNKLKFTSGEESTKLGNSTIYLWRQTGRTPATAAASTNVPPYAVNANAAAAHNIGGGFKRQTNQFQILDKQDKSQSLLQSTTSTSSSSNDDIPSATTSLCPIKDSQRLLTGLVDEVLDTSSWQEEILKVWQASSANQQVSLMHYLLVNYLHLGSVKSRERTACSSIFTHLMRTKSLDRQLFRDAYILFGEEFADVLVDVPNGWTYVFEFLGPILHERLLQFPDIWLPQWIEDSQFTERFVKALITHFTSEFGANYTRELWHKEFQLENGQIFMDDPAQWSAFVAGNGFQYIYERHCKAPHATNLGACAAVANTLHRSTGEQVQRIEFLLNTASECDLAIDYITTNVHINTNFISHLTKFLCCDYATVMMTNSTKTTTTDSGNTKQHPSTAKTQLNSELFRSKCTPLLRLCIDARETHEISCLDAVVSSLQQCYDMSPANELICSIFNILYDCEVIPKESFEKWYRARASSEASLLTTTNSGMDTQSHNSHSRGVTEDSNRLSSDLHAFMDKLL